MISFLSYIPGVTDWRLQEILDPIDFNQDAVWEFPDYCELLVWDISVMPAGHGHWRVSVKLEYDGDEFYINCKTTNSVSVDHFHRGEFDGIKDILIECFTENSNLIGAKLDV